MFFECSMALRRAFGFGRLLGSVTHNSRKERKKQYHYFIMTNVVATPASGQVCSDDRKLSVASIA